VSNLDPTHVIPFLAAGALQSGMALILMPTPTGFAVMLTQPEPMTDDEIERGAEASAIAVVDVKGLDVLALSYQLGRATVSLADYIASAHADQLTPEQQAAMRGLEPDTSANPGPFVKPTEPATPGVITYANELDTQRAQDWRDSGFTPDWLRLDYTEAERTAAYLHEVATQETGAND
jgi:hypothetical protein